MRRGRKSLEMVLHRFVKQFALRQQIRESPQFSAVWQMPQDEQVCNFDEGGFFGEFLDGYPAITQDSPSSAINESDSCFRHGTSGYW